MKRMMFAFLALGMAALVGCSGSSTSATSGGGGAPGPSGGGDARGGGNADKIVGVWTMTKVDGKAPPFAMDMEFTKEGKIKAMGMEMASYKVSGDKVTITSQGGKGKDAKEKTDVAKIKTLTDSALVLVDEEKKEEQEFTKKK
jgi:hypothetical protein